jgi:hypothetical protein
MFFAGPQVEEPCHDHAGDNPDNACCDGAHHPLYGTDSATDC